MLERGIKSKKIVPWSGGSTDTWAMINRMGQRLIRGAGRPGFQRARHGVPAQFGPAVRDAQAFEGVT